MKSSCLAGVAMAPDELLVLNRPEVLAGPEASLAPEGLQVLEGEFKAAGARVDLASLERQERRSTGRVPRTLFDTAPLVTAAFIAMALTALAFSFAVHLDAVVRAAAALLPFAALRPSAILEKCGKAASRRPLVARLTGTMAAPRGRVRHPEPAAAAAAQSRVEGTAEMPCMRTSRGLGQRWASRQRAGLHSPCGSEVVHRCIRRAAWRAASTGSGPSRDRVADALVRPARR